MKAERLKSLQVKRVLKIQQAIAAVVRSFLSALLFTRCTLKNRLKTVTRPYNLENGCSPNKNDM